MNWILLLGRLLFGGVFLFSGIHHLTDLPQLASYAAAHDVPYPQWVVAGTGLLLTLGGISVILGLAPRFGLAAILAFLAVVTPVVHAFWAVSDPEGRQIELAQFMKNTALAGAALSLLAIDLPWPVSLDRTLRRRWPHGLSWIPWGAAAHNGVANRSAGSVFAALRSAVRTPKWLRGRVGAAKTPFTAGVELAAQRDDRADVVLRSAWKDAGVPSRSISYRVRRAVWPAGSSAVIIDTVSGTVVFDVYGDDPKFASR